MKQTSNTEGIALREKLERGDYNTIAEMANVSRETVKKTLAGDRNNQGVIQAARALITTREVAKESFSNAANH